MEQINYKNFLYHIGEYGFFPEQLIENFSSADYAKKIEKLLRVKLDGNITIDEKIKAFDKNNKNHNTGRIEASYPFDFTIPNNGTRRILSIPNPYNFILNALYMKNNWDKIKEITKSEQSISPIYEIGNDYGSTEHIINTSISDKLFLKSKFIYNQKLGIKKSSGYKYMLTVDISKFYSSIYTHSITWAICGKDDAKNMYYTKNKRDENYFFGNMLDILIRSMKGNETNGIIIGPFISRIYSEILLSKIDKILAKKHELNFLRYVDDYNFYFHTELEANKALISISKELSEFGLYINENKTSLSKYPFHIIIPLREIIQNSYEKDGIYGVLNQANILYNEGQKGAYNYAMKFVQNKELKSDINLILSMMLNIFLIEPKVGKFMLSFLRNNNIKSLLQDEDRKKWKEIVNSEIFYTLKSGLDLELIVLIGIAIELNLEILQSNIDLVFASENDLAIIMLLDWLKNIKEINPNAESYNEFYRHLDNLKSHDFYSAKWLLLYEIKAKKIVREDKIKDFKFYKNIFVKNMLYNDISFYKNY